MNGLDRPSTGLPAYEQDDDPSIFRQNLRSRLREKEQKLSDMIRASRTSADSRMQMNEGMIAGNGLLGGSQDRRYQLEEPRGNVLRATSRDSSDILDKLSGIEQVSAEQSSRIQTLENELSKKNKEVNDLRDELVKKLEKIVTLEFELESRAVSLDPNFDTVSELDLGSLSNELDLTNKLSPGQTQVFFSQLLTDLRELEELYKEERIKSSLLQDQLRQENLFLQNTIAKRLADLDARLQNNEEERSQLTAAVEDKNREIEALKRELANLRLNAISEGNNMNDSIFTDFDTDLLRTASRSVDSTEERIDGKPLQLQLRDANMKLVRKDQQEAIERAKRNFNAQGSLLQLALLQRAKATAYLEDDQLDQTVDMDESFESPSPSPSRDSRRALQRDQEMAIERAKAASARFGARSVRKGGNSNPATEDTSRSTASRSSQQSSRRAVKQEQDRAIRRARTLFGRFRLGGGRTGGRFTI